MAGLEHDARSVPEDALDRVAFVRVDASRAHADVLSGPAVPVDVLAALVTRVTEARARGETLDGRAVDLSGGGVAFSARLVPAAAPREDAAPDTLVFACAESLAAPRARHEISASRFLARAPVTAWLTNTRGETLLLGRDAPVTVRERGAPQLERVALADLYGPADRSRYQALNELVIREGRSFTTTEEGPPIGPEGPSVYHVARFPVPVDVPEGGSEDGFEAGGVALEITDRVRLERDLARSEARHRAMLEATNDGVWVVGADFRTTFTNAAVKQILGYSDEELSALSPLDLAHPDDRAHVQEQQALRREGESMTGEVRMVAKDGRTVWMLHSSAPIKDESGAFLGAIAIFKDVTEQKAAEARARRMQDTQRLEVLARLAGGIAHDFNNLLTAVLTGADMLTLELPASDASHEMVDTIRQAGRRAAVLCRQLLGLSGRGRFSTAPLDVHESVSDAVRALRTSIDARHLVAVSRSADLPRIMADDAQIQQLVTNLILNASEAIGGRVGHIDVRVEGAEVTRETFEGAHLAPDLASGTYLRLAVTDDGPGIAEAVRDRLFEPFVTTRTMGRGLGLPAALGIVRGHGGAIRVRSEPGRGTEVEVFLPVVDADVAPVRSRAPHVAVQGQGQLVLVIDDEAMVRMAACRVLRARGFETIDAGGGHAGVELFAAHADRIALVLLDLSMPKMDGVETLVRIRAIRPGTPVVIMSGYSEDETAARFVGVGLASFLAKPFTPDQLVQKVRAAFVPAN